MKKIYNNYFNLSFNFPAFGPRPCLELPDHIIFASTAVKIPVSKTIPVKNIGEIDCTFSLVTSR